MQVDVLSGVSRNEGGLFYSVRWLSQSLSREGADIRVVSHIDAHTREDLPLWEPLNTELYRSFGPLQSSVQLRQLLTKSPADILHVHGIWLDRQWAALQWQKKTAKPVVVSPRGMLDPWALENSAWKKKLVGRLFANEALRKTSCMHALCQSEAESMRRYGLKNPIAVIPNAVMLPEEQPMTESSGRKQLLFLGRIHPKKGLSELLSGWVTARGKSNENSSAWRLVIAGWDDGGHLAGLKRQATELNLSWSASMTEDADVYFPGSVYGAEKETLLRGSNAFILPSFSEGLPMSVLEAWSYGLPVVMTDFCNIPAGFVAEAALRVSPKAASISEGIGTLCEMSDVDRAAMGAKGRELVRQHFTWDKVARDMKAVYDWCLSGEKPTCIQEV